MGPCTRRSTTMPTMTAWNIVVLIVAVLTITRTHQAIITTRTVAVWVLVTQRQVSHSG